MNRSLKKIASQFGALVVLFFCSFSYSNAQSPVVTNPVFYDDANVHVPLQFGFPFFGRTFTNSWMHSNGVVSFLDPLAPIPNQPYNPGQWSYCCQGLDLVPSNPQLGPQFNFMIAPLWTDLYPVAGSTFRTEGTTTYQKYFWNNIAEISNMNNLNTFSLEIRPTGFIGATYDLINIQNQQVAAGISGDISLGQMQKFYFGTGIPAGVLNNWSVNNTPGDQCVSNPLSSPTCSGYTQAMCSANSLYDVSCPGYQSAYFTQQCSISSLYSPNCPGYAATYLTYQCSINPLYSTTCEGYQQAYFNQQCSLSGLYSTSCPNYQQAYFNQQCTANPLYNSECPGYAAAYFTQQCNLNGLYDKQCPNYAQAYAQKMVLEQQGIASTVATAGVIASTAPTNSVSSEGTVSKTGDSNVDKAIASPTTATTSAASPAAPVQLTQPSGGSQQTAQQSAAVVSERKQEKQDNAKSGSSQEPSSQSGSKDQPKTARQEMQEKREAAAKSKAVEDGKNLAENMGKSASLEQQIAVQNVVLQAMSFVPGFDAYSRTIMVDKPFYKTEQIYKGQVNVDNRNLGRGMFGPSDQRHDALINSQYNR